MFFLICLPETVRQSGRRFGVFSKQDNARNLPVNTMHQPQKNIARLLYSSLRYCLDLIHQTFRFAFIAAIIPAGISVQATKANGKFDGSGKQYLRKNTKSRAMFSGVGCIVLTASFGHCPVC